MEKTKLTVKKRALQGSSNARRLRRTGNLPGVVYGEGGEALPVQINTHAFEQVLHHHASETMLLDIEIEGEGISSVLVKDVQHHPVTSELVHVDLLKVAADRLIEVEIPLEIVGEAAGVKVGGILELIMHSLEVECLPGDLVEEIQVNVTALGIGDALHAADIELPTGITILTDPEAIVVTVAAPRVEEEPVEEGAEGAAGAEPELISNRKAEDEETE